MKKTSSQSNTALRLKQNANFIKSGRNNGFSLVEVLVAIVVLSIGLLGLAGLQTTALKANNSAYQRSQASVLANDILDRMRANRIGIQAGYYNDPYSGGTPGKPTCIDTPLTGTPLGCGTENIADYDVYYWETSLANTLPNGQGAITGTGAGSVFTITVMWDDNRTGAIGTNCPSTPDPANELTCFVISTRI